MHYRKEGRLYEGQGALLDLAICEETKRRVVLKTWKDLEGGLAALRVYRNLIHPGVLPLYDAYHDGEHLVMVFPHLERGSLSEVVHLDQGEKRRMALQIAHTLEHLHRSGIVHHDLKPSNVLVGGEGSAYLIDLSRERDFSPGYGAPEKREEIRVDERSDIYSFGKLLEHIARKGRLVDRGLIAVARRAGSTHRLKRYQHMSAVIHALEKL